MSAQIAVALEIPDPSISGCGVSTSRARSTATRSAGDPGVPFHRAGRHHRSLPRRPLPGEGSAGADSLLPAGFRERALGEAPGALPRRHLDDPPGGRAHHLHAHAGFPRRAADPALLLARQPIGAPCRRPVLRARAGLGRPEEDRAVHLARENADPARRHHHDRSAGCPPTGHHRVDSDGVGVRRESVGEHRERQMADEPPPVPSHGIGPRRNEGKRVLPHRDGRHRRGSSAAGRGGLSANTASADRIKGSSSSIASRWIS